MIDVNIAERSAQWSTRCSNASDESQSGKMHGWNGEREIETRECGE